MKTSNITFLAALISSPLAAESLNKTLEIGVFTDYIKSSTNKEKNLDWQQVEAGIGAGIDLQKIINKQWDVRLELAKTRYITEDGNANDYATRLGLDAIYKIDDSPVYLFTGLKYFTNAKSYRAINVGAGYNLQINNRFSIYGEAAVYRDLNYGYTDQGLKLGLKYAFGSIRKLPVPRKITVLDTDPVTVTFIDTDNDGISNNNDSCNDTGANVKVDLKGCAIYSESTVAITLNVNFENNSSYLTKPLDKSIKSLADFMTQYKNTKTTIEGHTSSEGSEKYNLFISKKRALRVKDILVNKFNIDENRLSVKGLGESQLISAGSMPADHKVNRRVVAKIETTLKTPMKKD